MAIVGGVVMQRAAGANFFSGLLICFYQLASALLNKKMFQQSDSQIDA